MPSSNSTPNSTTGPGPNKHLNVSEPKSTSSGSAEVSPKVEPAAKSTLTKSIIAESQPQNNEASSDQHHKSAGSPIEESAKEAATASVSNVIVDTSTDRQPSEETSLEVGVLFNIL